MFQYSDSRLFKIYVGIGFGGTLLTILLILYCKHYGNSNSNKNSASFQGSQRHRISRKKPHDIEKAVLEPLLKQNSTVSKKAPPKLPPPDF